MVNIRRTEDSDLAAICDVHREAFGQGQGQEIVDLVRGLLGDEKVFVLGHPNYYLKFGFRPARALGFEAPYRIPAEHEDAWMVQEL